MSWRYPVTVAFLPPMLLGACGGAWEADLTGMLSGLQTGPGIAVVVQNNGGNDLILTANGPFSLGWYPIGSPYNVTIKAQPSVIESDPSMAQTCWVEGGVGKIQGLSFEFQWPLNIRCARAGTD